MNTGNGNKNINNEHGHGNTKIYRLSKYAQLSSKQPMAYDYVNRINSGKWNATTLILAE